MSTTLEPIRDIATVLFGKTRLAVLALLFTHDSETFYLREIIGLLGLGRGAVQRELSRLTEAGLVLRTVSGNQVHYQANRQSFVFDEIKSLMTKTTGVADVLLDALRGFDSRIKFALIYGSTANGTADAISDVDLCVIGDTSFADISNALSGAQLTLGRDVNPTVYSLREFKKKLREGHHFVNAVCDGPKIFLIGDADELRKMGEKRIAKAP